MEIFDRYIKILFNLNHLQRDINFVSKGGHSFKVKQNCKFIEVKQGPYSEGLDKENF